MQTKSVKCMTFVGTDQLWCGCGNGIAVVDIVNLRVLHQIPVFVKNMALVNEVISDGNAVWGVGLHLSCVLQWDVKTYSLVSVFDCSSVDPTGRVVTTVPTEFEDLFAGGKKDTQASDPETKMLKYETSFKILNETINPSKSILTISRSNSLTCGPNVFKKVRDEKRYSVHKTKKLSSYQCSTHATSLAILNSTLWVGRGMGDIIILDISRGPAHGKVLARLATEDCQKYGNKSYHKLVAAGGKYVVSSQWLEKISDRAQSGTFQKVVIWEAWSRTDIENFAALVQSDHVIM